MLELVGLEDAANQFPDQLSGGMQQRVGVARAFAANPEVMLYDEPFSALDPLIRREMQDEVMRLQREIGKTTMFITHDLPEALRLGDRIAIMRDGAIVQLGTPEELVGSPADDYVENFTRDIPRSHVLTLRWIMREPGPADATDGPRLDVTTTMRKALPVIAATEKPVCCIEDGRMIGIVDRTQYSVPSLTRGRLTVSTIVEVAPTTVSSSLLLEHRPWWRSRVTLRAAIVGADARLLLRSQGRVPVAGRARLDDGADTPQRLSDMARRPTERGQPERRHPSIQRLRFVPGRPRRVADPALRLDDLDRHSRRRRSRRRPVRRV